ncbi:MFS transporter [Mycolicibacterium brumae]|uniref:MFS transporter n=1 Tax=Mycolicibacterium brumae TaxID=85968 RepID=A0A2G5PG17_9MYCO|nr:MFS transporter [Mycolicibacterium brumae]MCV7194338.1 MFS transporter [Mycolicibacterium brumae]PIB77261.1 MFS transporter [Mycolicibacterium brumae]RWA15514.1 hypothetical protein MBRU_10715 [Mycolicibacterium brumae DSM 44177]UWW10625.1 MFS transporter [Mycolicibacterium brumae]
MAPRDSDELRATGRMSWPVMIPLLVGILAQSLAVSMINTALPKLARDLSVNPADQAWVVNIYPLALAAAIVPAARFGDRAGRRTALATGAAAFAVLSAIAPLLPVPGLLAARLGLGVAGALILANVVATIGAVFTGHARTVANGLWVAVFGAANTIGPLVGGYLTDHWGWQWVFWICVPIAGAAALLTRIAVPNTRAPYSPPWHPGWVLVAAVGLGATVYGVQRLPFAPGVGALVAVAGGAVLTVFLRAQRRLRDPLLRVSLFGDGGFSAAVATIVVSAGITLGVTYVTSVHLQDDRGWSASATGLVLLWQAIATTAGGVLAPMLARIDRRGLVLPAALLAQAAGLAWAATDPVSIGPPLALIGAGFGVIGTLGTTALFISSPRDAVSQVGVVQEVSFALGAGLGIAVLAALMAPWGYSGALAAAAAGVTITAAVTARAGRPLA